jgi:hypothetical protein
VLDLALFVFVSAVSGALRRRAFNVNNQYRSEHSLPMARLLEAQDPLECVFAHGQTEPIQWPKVVISLSAPIAVSQSAEEDNLGL